MFNFQQGLNTAAPNASVIENQNALALAIIPTDGEHLVTHRFDYMFTLIFFSYLLADFSYVVLFLYFQVTLQRLALVMRTITIPQDGS